MLCWNQVVAICKTAKDGDLRSISIGEEPLSLRRLLLKSAGLC